MNERNRIEYIMFNVGDNLARKLSSTNPCSLNTKIHAF